MVQYMDNGARGFQQFSQMKEKAAPKYGLFLWIILFLLAYWMFLPEKKVDTVQKPEVEQVDVSKVPKHTIKGDGFSAMVQGLRISNVTLDDYQIDKGDSENIKLLANEKDFVEVGILASGTTAPIASTLWKTDRSINPAMTFRGDNAEYQRKITTTGYVITVSDSVRNTGKSPIFLSQYARIARSGGEKSRFSVHTGGIANINGEIEKEGWDDIENNPHTYSTTQNKKSFVGFSDQYWQIIIASNDAVDSTIKMRMRADKIFQAEIAPEFVKLEPGKTAIFGVNIFAGPKTQAALAVAESVFPEIGRTLDYGWFGFLSRPFLWTLIKLHDFFGNYGVAIILLTLIIRTFMWPITRKSFKSMAAMQKIQPEMQRIQRLYSNDKMRMQQEILRLYSTHKTNPLSSIGMMFLQIPIFFALYKALVIAVPLRHAEFLWLKDLSVMDPYFVLPILMALIMWLQNRLTNAGKNSDMPGSKIMRYMPFIFGLIFAWMPSGLVLYWTVSSAAGIVQLMIMKKGERQ